MSLDALRLITEGRGTRRTNGFFGSLFEDGDVWSKPLVRAVEGGNRPRVAIVIGTRPEVIKLAPVCRALVSAGAEVSIVLTGQHRELVDELVVPLEIAEFVAADLNVMRPRQNLTALAARLLDGLGGYFEKIRPDAVVVQGDTTSALCGALAAFHERVPVAHVEAGLRSGFLSDPFPEEMNRQLISRMTRWQFAPTTIARDHLERENITATQIEVVGNTVVDSLQWVLGRGIGTSAFAPASETCRILVTLHRRDTRGAALTALAESIRRIAEDLHAEVVFPVHPSPEVRHAVMPVLGGDPRVHTCRPLGYFDFLATLADADLAISDSGGVQEEAPTLGTPVLVARETTERPEAIEAGCALLVGTDPLYLEAVVGELFGDEQRLSTMANVVNPFGDGHAAERIAERILTDLADTTHLSIKVGRS